MTTSPDWMPPHLRPDGETASASAGTPGTPSETRPVASDSVPAKSPLRELQDLLWPDTYTPRQAVVRARVGASLALVEALWPLALVMSSDLAAVALRSALFLIAAVGMWRMKASGAVLAIGATAFLFMLDLLSGARFSIGFFVLYLSVFDEARRAIESRREG
jgi:hypothetical protein